MRKLEEQIALVQMAINNAMMYPNLYNVTAANAEFRHLKGMLEGLMTFANHRWQVKLSFGQGVFSEMVDLNAEHLEEAREKADAMMDRFGSAIRYELYCDGKLVPEDGS